MQIQRLMKGGIHIGGGGSKLTYSDKDLQELYDLIEKYVDSRLTINLDLFGLYLPVTTNTIAGVIIHATGDRFDYDNEWIQENYYLYSLSTIHYLNEFGKGLFVRADVGSALYNYQDSDGRNRNSDEVGLGFLVGGGLSLKLGNNSLLLNLNYVYRNIDDVKTNCINVSLGGLF